MDHEAGGLHGERRHPEERRIPRENAYNAPFADSVDAMQDFWNVPVFNELLTVTQRYVGMAVDGEMPTEEALKKLAEEKERILKDAGSLGA